MNPEIKAQWVAALRSGEYEQGKGYLNSGGKFCCLGVLSDLAEKAGVVSSEQCGAALKEGHHLAYKGETDSFSSDSFLPKSVQLWAAVDSEDPVVTDNAVVDGEVTMERSLHLSSFNDQLTYNFDKIADLIEANL